MTVVLCMFPSLVSLLHFWTDVRDVLRFPFEQQVYVRVIVEAILVQVVCVLTYKIVKFVVDTSVLLNAWHLAVRDV